MSGEARESGCLESVFFPGHIMHLLAAGVANGTSILWPIGTASTVLLSVSDILPQVPFIPRASCAHGLHLRANCPFFFLAASSRHTRMKSVTSFFSPLSRYDSSLGWYPRQLRGEWKASPDAPLKIWGEERPRIMLAWIPRAPNYAQISHQ